MSRALSILIIPPMLSFSIAMLGLRIPVLYGFGPAGWQYYPIETKGLFDARPTEQEEAESDYLDRTGLWADGEREAWENQKTINLTTK